MPQCEECGQPLEDPRECSDCGHTYCDDHAAPILHGCNAQEDTDEVARPGVFLLEVAVLAVVVILFAGLFLGVVSPSALLGGEQSDSPPEKSPEFDATAFRTAVFEQINERRARAGTDRLEVNESRQEIAQGVARDLGRATAGSDSNVSIARRIERANVECTDENETLWTFRMRTHYRRPIQTDEGVVRHNTTEQVAAAVVERMRADLDPMLESEAVDTQGVGVYLDPKNAVYVVYVAC